MPVTTKCSLNVFIVILFVSAIPQAVEAQLKGRGTSSSEYYKKLNKMTPEQLEKYRERIRRNVTRKPNADIIKKNIQRKHEQKIKKQEHDTKQAKIQKENQAAYEAQARRDQFYYDTVLRPQELKEAEFRYQQRKDIADKWQKFEEIQIQRNRNWILQQGVWNNGYGPRRNPIIYGVQPYGIRLPY